MDGLGRGVAGMSGWRGGHVATESNEATWRAKHRNIGNVLRDALRFIRLCFLNSTIFSHAHACLEVMDACVQVVP
jgi:hypothetical protein